MPMIEPMSHTFQLIASALSGFLVFIFGMFMIWESVKGRAKLNATSWLIWVLNDVVILIGTLRAGASNTLIVPLLYTVLGALILTMALRYHWQPLGSLEKVCLALAALGWILLFMTKDPLFALSLGVVVNTLGTLPTLIRLKKNPYAEPFLPWFLNWLSSLFSIMSVERLNLELLLFPVDVFLLSGLVVLMISRPPKLDGGRLR